MRRFWSGLVAVVTSCGFLTVGGAASADAATDAPVVAVRGGVHGVTVSRDTVPTGRVVFRVATTNRGSGSIILMFRPLGKATRSTLLKDFSEEASNIPAVAAKGTRDLTRNFTFFGLADVVVGTPATVSEYLRPGAYYLIDGLASVIRFTVLHVRVNNRSTVEASPGGAGSTTVSMTSADRFTAPRVLPARGTVTLRNAGDSIHQLEMVRVQRGTTDAQVTAYLHSRAFRHGRPAAFDRPGPTIGVPLLSPGRELQVGYALPRGTYVLVCRVADDQTGIPHLVMGMHKVVVLR